jgi:hypothetical protein
MKYGLRLYSKEHIRGHDDDFRFVSEQRAINDARRATRNGSAFKVEVWAFSDTEVLLYNDPIRVYFGAVADGLREHVENVVVRPLSGGH